MIISTAKEHYQQNEKTVEWMFENGKRGKYSEYQSSQVNDDHIHDGKLLTIFPAAVTTYLMRVSSRGKGLFWLTG